MTLKPQITLFMLLGCISLTGCSTTEYVSANATPPRQAAIELPPHLYMDVGILPFDPNIPTTEEALEKQLIVPDVRRAESQYIAYHLKDTMEQTGNWGAVRLTPDRSESVDLTVEGTIISSDGESLVIQATATDATGRRWFSREYEDTASKYSYEKDTRDDPFQDLYNEIANDLLTYRENLAIQEISRIRDVAALKYARSLSPEAFGKYLKDSGDKVALLQLPAETDRMLMRVDRIKEREYLFVDTLDDFYGNFYRDMRPSYHEWRFATYSEAIKLRQLEKKSRNQLLGGAAMIAGGLYAGSKSGTYAGQAGSIASVYQGVNVVKAGLMTRKDAEIHAQSLQELSQSLGSEITPYIVSIEGRTIELKGTADAQYTEWRRILKDIYAAETGTPVQN